MTLQVDEEDAPAKQVNGEANLEPVRSNPVRRMRWATHRATPAQARRTRNSILKRMHLRNASKGSNTTAGAASTASVNDEDDGDEKDGETSAPMRTIYFNRPLPDSARDEDGHPIAHFPRNKIRTAKYTPLSFIPKNLWFQFHNIANVYFLFIIILSIFSIFGAANAGLNAVPLIVILFITAVKDAIEDFRRTVLDNELNNSPVHRLVEWNNVNTAEDKVSAWRRFKKANSRAIRSFWQFWKHRQSKKATKDINEQEPKEAVDTASQREAQRISTYSDRTSGHFSRSQTQIDALEMTPITTKTPNDKSLEPLGIEQTPVDSEPSNGYAKSPASNRKPATPFPERFYGSLIDPTKTASGKATFKKQYWKDVQVGDFVRLYNEEQVPADVVVLATSDPDGACYVETKNLDGETNLKVKQALHAGRKIKRARDCERVDFYIDSQAPHANLYQYSGVARWMQRDPTSRDSAAKEMAEPISVNNLLLRGSAIRNTEWVLGVVVFTGSETKIMLNSGITPSKRAKISRDLNWNVIYNFIILFGMCLATAIAEGTYWGKSNTSADFFEFGNYGSTAGIDGFITFWAAVILYQNLIPISLYISLEIIRTFQAYFIYSDALMYYEKLDYPCTPKSWNISDDLGQIEYIFSDKTGTLTQNVMEFKKCTINGVAYGEAYTEALAGLHKRRGVDVEVEGAKAREQIETDKILMLERLREIHDNPYLRDEDLTFVAPGYVADLTGAAGQLQQDSNHHFMLALALCHTVITERTPGNPPRIEFKAQSPDEAALVATARDCGFTVIGRSNDQIIINVMGKDTAYTVLNTLEFNSARKRMSAIIRMPDGKIILFCKGADSVIYSRLRAGQQTELRKQTAEHLEMFAREGLRTLCIAQRELSEEEYQEWNKEHDEAAAAVDKRDEKLDAVSDEIEQELTLLGGTAIEDRLQDGVPDAIALLGQAGIKLWVLTGDKVETAINIGFSCNLLNNDMDLILFRVEDESMETAEQLLNKSLEMFNMTGSDEELVAAKKNHEPPPPTHAIVIDGEALKLVLREELRQKFLLLCKQCRSVLCCRVSPAQKAAVVSMVKHGLDVITLSIGDGANDVAMIQEADVGVGIAGEEGRQAVMSSDFAIGQFRFLARLTLVHGRWCYRRLAEMIANFFYKNLVWTFALLWFNIYENFDCSYIYDYTYILLYNLAFTSLPVIFMGILDQDVGDKISLAVPQLYRRGIERKEWTQTKFWIYMFDGLYQSVMVFYMAYLIFAPGNFSTFSGLQINDTKRMGTFIAHAAIITVNLYILMNTYRWDWLMLLVTAISILLIWFWTGVWTASRISFQFYKAAPEVYAQASFWAETVLAVVICLLPRFAAKAIQKIYRPRDADIIREQVRQGKFDYLDNEDPSMLIPSRHNTLAADGARQPHGRTATNMTIPEDERPIMNPPSTAHTDTTYSRNHMTQNSDDTMHSLPLQTAFEKPPRPSYERFDSRERIRPSFEAARENLTTAAHLTRMESSNSVTKTRKSGEAKHSPLSRLRNQ